MDRLNDSNWVAIGLRISFDSRMEANEYQLFQDAAGDVPTFLVHDIP